MFSDFLDWLCSLFGPTDHHVIRFVLEPADLISGPTIRAYWFSVSGAKDLTEAKAMVDDCCSANITWLRESLTFRARGRGRRRLREHLQRQYGGNRYLVYYHDEFRDLITWCKVTG